MDGNRRSAMLFIALASAFLLFGCASMGNKVLKEEDSASIEKKIIKGKTKKEEVRSIFGDPMSVSFRDSGNLTWRYVYTKGRSKPTNFIPIVNLFASGMKGKKKELVVLFDADGIVKDYSMSTSNIEGKAGLLQ